ncbi:MAG: ribose 5-phosphate isomerase B [Bdellovibrionota bacterium]
MNIAIGSDHAGVELKEKIKTFLESKSIEVLDVGPHDEISVDYPDYAKLVTDHVCKDKNTLGILICGTGIGMSIAANKVNGIRAALVTSVEMAEMTKRHNNANVLCLSARMIDPEVNLAMVKTWLETDFEGDRHQRRIDKIHALEQ